MKHVVEYSAINEAYAEGAKMCKLDIAFFAFIAILAMY